MDHETRTKPATVERIGRRGRRLVTSGVATIAGLAALVGITAVAGPASAVTVNGIATIAAPGATTALLSGGSTAQFTVALPNQAACSGDTATGGYHVYSYLIHKGASLSSVTFNGFPSAGFGLVDTTGTYYGAANTAATTGQIIAVPNDFEWAPLVTSDGGSVTLSQLLYTGSGTSATGIWETGLVCANSSGAVVDNWNSEVSFAAKASDPNGFNWTAVPGPSGSTPAAFTSASSTSFTDNTAGTFTPTASGSPAPVITESGTLPTGVTFTGGVLSGTPTVSGTFPITLTATNGIESAATQNFTLTVTSAGFQITTTSLPNAVVGTPYSVQLTTAGAPSGATVAWKKVLLPKGFALSSGGLLTGTPSDKALGAQSVKVSVTDTKGGTPLTATLSVTVNEAPAFGKKSPIAAGFTEGQASTVTLSATGFPAPTFSKTGTLPSGVTLNTTTGVLSGTPAVTANSSQDAITIEATNGIGTPASETFTLSVYAPLVVATAPLSIAQGATVSGGGFQLATITGTEVGGALKVKASGLPKGLVLSATGVLTGTVSTKDVAKAYAVTITVSSKDGKTAVTATGNATITVTS
jgi:hypothetical protein